MKIGTLLSARYDLVGEIGRGGMAEVFRARDRRLGREVAIKLISTFGLDEIAIERFQREALLVAGLDHPAIVPIYDYGRHEESGVPGELAGRWLFFVMPVLPGLTLHQLIRDRGLGFEDFLEVFARVAEALDHSAGQHVVHRDIKPENVMVAQGADGRIERVWLMDFGLAVAGETSRLTRTGNLPGTLAYLSPEQVLSSDDFDGRSDIYSLGVIGYEFLAGRTPFSGSPATLLYHIVHSPPPGLPKEADPAFARLIARCLAKQPAERPASGRELAFEAREVLRERRGLPAIDRRRAGSVAEPPAAAGGSPWVGRAREIEELEARLAAAAAGACHLAMIGGDPGVGKSRLLLEIEQRARRREMLVLQGRFSDPEGSFPHQGFCELIQDFFRQRKAEGRRTPLASLAEVAADLIDLFPRLAEIPEIAGAVGGGPRPATGDPGHLYEVIARALALLAGGRPTALLLEGIQAAEASLPLLLFLFRRLGATPTLIACTYRRTEVGRRHPFLRLIRGLEGEERFLHLELEKLSRDDHRRLVEAAMGGSPVTTEIAERLYEATDGNPLFTIELVRSLNRSGELRTGDSGQLELADGAAAFGEIPLTLQQALEGRLERLPPRLDLTLQLAAVLSRRFELRDLEALVEALGDHELLAELEEAIDALIAEGLLEEERNTRRGDWLRFASGLVREVAYGRIHRRRRRRLHQKVALGLERRFSDRLIRVYPQLIHHWAEADDAERTVAYSVLHVRQLAAGSAWIDVARAVRLALEFLEEEVAESAELPTRAEPVADLATVSPAKAEGELRFFLARALRATTAFDLALREGERALRACERVAALAEAAEVCAFLAETCWQLRRIEQSQRWLAAGLERGRQAGAASVLRQLLELQATIANLRGDYATAAEALGELHRTPGLDRGTLGGLPVPRRGGVVRVGLRHPLGGKDPAATVTMADGEVLANVFESLFDVDVDGRLLPWLCRSFSVAADGAVYEVEIDGDGVFSDGTPLDAATVARSLEDAARRAPRRLETLVAPIRGGRELLDGRVSTLAGLRVIDPLRLRIELDAPISFFPALLSDLRAAIVLEREGVLHGTGPFRLAAWSSAGARLERNTRRPEATAPWLDGVEFKVHAESAHVADGLSRGELEVGLELRANDLESLRRLPELRGGVQELQQHAIGVLLLGPRGRLTREPRLRRLLAGLIDVRDLLWRTIARFVTPAFGLLPSEVLGHHPTREPRRLSRLEAIETLEELGLKHLRLRALTHGRFVELFRPLMQAMLGEWALLGIDVDVEEVGSEELFRRVQRPTAALEDEIDLVFTRFAPDYLDADAFTYDQFHRTAGFFGPFLGSEELDRLCEQGRHEQDVAARDALYRRIEDILLERDLLLPLCRDVGFRVVVPSLHGVGQRTAAVATSFERAFLGAAGRERGAPAPPSGVLEVPITTSFPSVDPAISYLLDAADVLSNVFETLTQVGDKGGIEPLLAESIEVLDGGGRYRFRLRAVRFHDGRRLTTRDVRYSLARTLRYRPVEFSLFTLPLVGGADFAARRSDELPGFVALNEREFELAIDPPLPYFLAMLSHPSTAILPEGATRFDVSWREGCAGTGPFRVVACEAGRRVELAAHTGYWRAGMPRLERLVFQMATDPAGRAAGLREGRFGLASGLLPADVDAFARDAGFVAGLRRHPSFVAGLAAFNARIGPLALDERRQAVYRCLEEAADEAVAAVGALALRAHTLIPPGIPGAPSAPLREAPPTGKVDLRGLELRVAVHDAFAGHYRGVRERLQRAVQRAGGTWKEVAGNSAETVAVLRSGGADLALLLWGGPYPDPEAFATLTDEREGLLGPWIADQELADLRQRARLEPDAASRRVWYQTFEWTLARRALLLPLLHEQTCWIGAPGLVGLRPRFCWPRVAYAELGLER
jgi:ABC-type transport system substrate-binding protein